MEKEAVFQPESHVFDDRLDSWKEIASYLGREVRTVQRWEKQEGLPVHRHLHERQGTVYAFKNELDKWVRSRRVNEKTAEQSADEEAVIESSGIIIQPFVEKSTARSWKLFTSVVVGIVVLAAGFAYHERQGVQRN